MNEKENLNDATTGKEISKRHKLENEIDTLLNEIDSDLKQLETELKAQKKRKINIQIQKPKKKYWKN